MLICDFITITHTYILRIHFEEMEIFWQQQKWNASHVWWTTNNRYFRKEEEEKNKRISLFNQCHTVFYFSRTIKQNLVESISMARA